MDNSVKYPGDIQAAINAGINCSDIKVQTINKVPFTAVVEGVKLEKHLDLVDDPSVCPTPKRLTGCVELEEPDSFCVFVEIFKSPAMRLYGYPDANLFRAVFNDADPDKPAWRDHSAKLQLKYSPEWQQWLAASTGYMSQQELADFFVEHMDQIASPDATDLLSDIRNIRIDDKTKITSVQHEGGDIVFNVISETSATTTTQRGRIPSQLTLMIAPFRSWATVSLTVNLSYKYAQGALGFKLKPVQAEQHVQKVFNDIRNHVSEKVGVHILI